jgi:hypothetical protein
VTGADATQALGPVGSPLVALIGIALIVFLIDAGGTPQKIGAGLVLALVVYWSIKLHQRGVL